MKPRRKLDISFETLEKLVNEGKSVTQIAKLLNVANNSIHRRLVKYNLKTVYTSDESRSNKKSRNKFEVSKEELEELITQNLSTRDIANILNVSPSMVYNKLKKYNLSTIYDKTSNMVDKIKALNITDYEFINGHKKAKLEGREYIQKHTDETREKLSKLACQRLAKNSKYSKNIEYKPGVILESSYEVETAKILDDLNIEWIKVRWGFVWKTEGVRSKRYIPDFYLPKYDLYLDPKNDYLIIKDAEKIQLACEKNNIKVEVLDKKSITKEKILEILSNYDQTTNRT